MSKYYTDTPFNIWLIFDCDNGYRSGINSIEFSKKRFGYKLNSLSKKTVDAVFDSCDISLFDYDMLKLDESKKSFNLDKFLISTKKGEIFSYSDLAFKVFKYKRYARAVASMLHVNPYALFVPCHRVVAKNGIGGYAKGVELKKQILEWEGVDIKEKGW